MERANLKVRRKDVYDRLVAEWYAWNNTMLPEIDESYTDNFTGDQLADHIGAQKAGRKGRDHPVCGSVIISPSGGRLRLCGGRRVWSPLNLYPNARTVTRCRGFFSGSSSGCSAAIALA